VKKKLLNIVLIATNSLWIILLLLLFLIPNKKDRISFHKSELENAIFGFYFSEPNNYETALRSRNEYYYLINDLSASESNIRKELEKSFNNGNIDFGNISYLIRRLYNLYYNPGVRLESMGQFEIAKEKFRRGLNQCYYFAKKYHIGDSKFQRLYSSFRLRHDFYKRYEVSEKVKSLNSSFYDYRNSYNIELASNRSEIIKNQDFSIRRLFGLSNTIFHNLTLLGVSTHLDEEEEHLFELIIENFNYIINESSFDLIEESYYRLGIVYSLLGINVEAKKNFHAIINKFPDSYLADDALIQLISLETNQEYINVLEKKLRHNYKTSDLANYYFKWK
jgi:tetratricopeptide (TPR) repeat protein